MTIENEVKSGSLNNTIKHFLSGMISRAKDEGFKDLKLLDNIVEAVLLFVDSPLTDIRNAICTIILAMVHKINKFYFYKYPEIIFALCKSEYYSEYRNTVTEIMKIIHDEDCGFLVELYNRYPNKTLKLYSNFFAQVKVRDSSLQCLGRFMITSSYTHFTSSRG